MQITISVKQPGRKYALIDRQLLEVDDITDSPSLRELLQAVVKQQVAAYNDKPLEKNLLPFLSAEQTDDRLATGKAGFGSIYNEHKADAVKAQETALQAFEDGLFAVFINDEEMKHLPDKISLNNDTVITFVRLTFLAGSIW
ncbi:hypothetical protein [Chitinophaga arvensicola]|uniref:Uncharacterized protein n=1 Tax=Chitinophaga arvensicola TaxID=29529 RepID=A0A1I0S7T3_9BACT|nr:hypothetical protein [Chitinophaga arvensicola]SEW51899.1 hypothetical protein SAMN04488122_4573 [Chitinophaga arvensicola]